MLGEMLMHRFHRGPKEIRLHSIDHIKKYDGPGRPYVEQQEGVEMVEIQEQEAEDQPHQQEVHHQLYQMYQMYQM